MALPVVAIVGRPNVGKSSLLNRLVGRRISIVDPTPGVTRDRVSSPCPLQSDVEDGDYVELVDTGGMGVDDPDMLTEHIEGQIGYAIREADLILFTVDAREGVLPLDERVAKTLRRSDADVLLVANKIDSEDMVTDVGELHRLGFGEPMSVSALQGVGVDELLSEMRRRLAGRAGRAESEPTMKLAVVGKRNAGKSTFVNALAGENRVIVSETPGTTRDSIDVTVDLDDQRVTVIDTAGVRKKSRTPGGVEFFSRHRALRSVRRADVVLLMIDASVEISQVDKELAGQVIEQHKPVVLVVNKWDLAAGVAEGQDYAEYFSKKFPELSYAPISLTIAEDGTNVAETVRLAGELYAQAKTRVPTGKLNEVVEEIMELQQSSAGSRRPKVYYASQVETCPPMIVCFVNDMALFDRSYQRFVLNRLRERLPFAEVPIRLVFRQHRREDREEHRR
ncbi:MAG: ribosome biogenesis GTPase Der [Planctomycetota bacterium]